MGREKKIRPLAIFINPVNWLLLLPERVTGPTIECVN
jgi:hypothetical protein